MKVKISEIRTDNRFRKELGNIKSLAENIERDGLLYPILITKDRRLIDGYRRLTACKLLGWKEIEVNVLSENP